MMTLLFWDIDGTLLTTGRAGIFAWEDACREVTGCAVSFHAFKTDGLTDHQIAQRIVAQTGGEAADTAFVERLVRRYEDFLPGSLPKREGRVHPGVRQALEHFRAARPDVHSLLLTGNTAAGARAKLAHYGLDQYFEGGAFSEDVAPRSAIARRALEAACAQFPQARAEASLFVIGDTPHDIECARAIGARAVAVATGVYSAIELAAHDPWQVLDEVPPPDVLERLLDGCAADV